MLPGGIEHLATYLQIDESPARATKCATVIATTAPSSLRVAVLGVRVRVAARHRRHHDKVSDEGEGC
jgi:hypothetical protein